MFSKSLTVVGFRLIAVFLLQVRNERKEEFAAGIALPRLGPILEKYLRNRLAISTGLMIRYGPAFRFKRRWERRLTLSLVYNFI